MSMRARQPASTDTPRCGLAACKIDDFARRRRSYAPACRTRRHAIAHGMTAAALLASDNKRGRFCVGIDGEPARAGTMPSLMRAAPASACGDQARRVANQMPNAIGTMPAMSIHDTGSPSTAQPNSRPSGGIRKCSALAEVALLRPRIVNHRA